MTAPFLNGIFAAIHTKTQPMKNNDFFIGWVSFFLLLPLHFHHHIFFSIVLDFCFSSGGVGEPAGVGLGIVWEGEEGDGDFVGELSVFHDDVGAFDVVFEGAGCGVGEGDGVFFVRGVADEVGFFDGVGEGLGVGPGEAAGA